MRSLIVEKIKKTEFCVFDLETTGGNHQADKVIEIGLVKVKNLQITDEKNFLIRPEITIPIFIQKLTSINQHDVEDAPLIEEVIEEILEFMKNTILVAHNTSFDIPFFNSVLERLNKPLLSNKSMCTHLMTKYMIPNLMNSNLHYMCNVFGIDHDNAHRALDDARACSHLLLKYLDIFIDRNIKKMNHLYYPKSRYELNQIHYQYGDITLDDFKNKLRKIQSPFFVSIKGKEGLIIFALPCLGLSNEIDFVTNQLKKLQWETVTIKLYGPFLESLISFSFLFDQLNDKEKSRIMSFLWKTHFSKAKEKRKSKAITYNFIITNHLVPEQLIIYPLSSLYSRKELVFRYPSHSKKLLNYIKSTRIQKNEKFTDKQLKKFIQHYLENALTDQRNFLFFHKKNSLQSPYKFFKDLDKFVANNPNHYNYPKNYL